MKSSSGSHIGGAEKVPFESSSKNWDRFIIDRKPAPVRWARGPDTSKRVALDRIEHFIYYLY
jgi:hypothetical protein